MLNSLIIAFSMYSRIPMPRTEWKEKNMKYALCFFPLIGGVLFGILYGCWYLCNLLGIGSGLRAVLFTVLPILVTGGIHMDGFMDVGDAMSSYQSKEKRLEIMKDSHIGAFAMMKACVYFLFYVGLASELKTRKQIVLFGIIFVLERAMSAICFSIFPSAKKDGLQKTFADAMSKKVVVGSSVMYLILSAAVLLYVDLVSGLANLVMCLCLFLYFKRFTDKYFGGITGDLAGYYLQLQEILYLVVIVMVPLVQ